MKTIKDLLGEHHFFEGLDASAIETIAGCGTNVVFKRGDLIAREGQPADYFYVIRKGRVAIDIAAPAHGQITIQTLAANDVLGFSWIVSPHQWRFDCQAVLESHAVKLDGKCLRGKCDADCVLGYALLNRFSAVLAQRLEMTRLQLLDIYGEQPAASGVVGAELTRMDESKWQ